jgi:hypothetical protein
MFKVLAVRPERTSIRGRLGLNGRICYEAFTETDVDWCHLTREITVADSYKHDNVSSISVKGENIS